MYKKEREALRKQLHLLARASWKGACVTELSDLSRAMRDIYKSLLFPIWMAAVLIYLFVCFLVFTSKLFGSKP